MPTYAINDGDLIEIQVLGRLHGQRTRNVFHYLATLGASVEDGVTELNELADAFQANVWAQIQELLSNEFTHEHTTIQKIAPTRYRAIAIDGLGAGDVQTTAMPSGVAAVIRRTGIASGRRYQGRVYIPGLPTSAENNSLLADATFDALDLAALSMLNSLASGGLGDDYVPIVSTQGAVTTLDQVTDTAVDRVLRYQRRREVGVGE